MKSSLGTTMSNISKDISDGSLPITCRICIKNYSDQPDQCLSLYQNYRDSSISQLISLIADVKYVDGDGYPAHICNDCLVDFETALNFKERCENSDSLFNKKHINNLLINPIPIKTEKQDIDEYLINFEDPINNEHSDIEDSVGGSSINHEDFQRKEADVKDSFNHLYSTKFEYTISVGKTNNDSTLSPSFKQAAEVQCHDCGEMFKTKCKLRVHWKKVHMLEAQTCQLCKRVFKSFFAFRRHNKLNKKKLCINTKFVYVEGVGKGRTYNCTKCSYSSKLIQSIKFHSFTHIGNKKYVCELCSKAFIQLGSLHRHCESAHKQYRKEITCQYCGLFVQGGDKVYKHLRRHKDNRLQCDICKKFIKGKCNMINHLKRHTGLKPYKCEKCAALFATSSDLANHKRNSHSTQPPPIKSWYTCDLCGYRTHQKFVLKKHKLKHSEKNFACGECGQFFEDSLKLEKHLETHFGEKVYACPLCDAKFYHRNGRSRHLKVKHNKLSAELKLPRRAYRRNRNKK